ncbi:SDR family oxidoreductase [Flavobacterium anhuiense]|uniref:SDR family oxidoreductase n=1 Tax=Flavobacterium anhuiense TaxID=459526 RepID=UPI0020273A2E|nr:SDR family oxidoreductase [Flavobacterium anhuiense]URM35714.1 SDR family oxidoreductase [Flavobacterium anhuiense]
MKSELRTNELLNNKKIVVLGGSSGLGFAAAKAAKDEGACVTIVSSNQKRLSAALKLLSDETTGFTTDLSKEENIKNLFSQIGNFDHLIYTAGENISMNMIDDMNIEEAKNFFTIRFWGALAAIKYGKQFLNKGGSITLMSGNFGQRPSMGYSLGASICGAMDAFTRAMAIELAPIRINNIAAGVIKTNLWDNLKEEDRIGFYKYIEDTSLLKRVGEPEDIAQAFLYLIKQPHTTGQSLIIDGGAVLV